MSNSPALKLRLKVLTCSANVLLYDSEFQTEGALTLKAFTDICGTESNNLLNGHNIGAGRQS